MPRLRIPSQKGRRSPYALLAGLAGAVLLAAILHATGPLRPVESLLLRILSPLAGGISRTGRGTGEAFSAFFRIGSLPKENARLQAEVDDLRVQVAHVEELSRENAILREQLGFVKEAQAATIPALVIGRAPSAEFQMLVIDKGTRDGVKEDLAVVASSGLLVGRVYRSDEATANVLLLTDVHSTVHAVVQGSRANGIVVGDRGLGLLLDSLPPDAQIKPGDQVLSTGLAGPFPKGLLIGSVEEAPEPGNELFRRARVRPAVDFNRLEFVFVVKPS